MGFIPIRSEKFRKANANTQGFYRFPFKLGDKWSLRFDVNTWTNFKVDKNPVKITTPAGEFDTLRISMKLELEGRREGRNWSERWYSPSAKNYVKIINHRETDFTEFILTKYKAE